MGSLLLGNRFPLKIKGKVLSLLCKISNIVWKRDMVIKRKRESNLKRTERAIVRAMCGQEDN